MFLLAPSASASVSDVPEIQNAVPAGKGRGGEEDSAENIVGRLLREDADGSVKSGIARRIAGFILERDKEAPDGKSFVLPKLSKLPEKDQIRAGTEEAVGAWMSGEAGNGADAACLYALLVGDDLPRWMEGLTREQKEAVRRAASYKPKLLADPDVDRWTSERGETTSDNFPISPLGGTRVSDWTRAFLRDAGSAAREVHRLQIRKERLPEAIEKSVAENQNRGAVPGDSGTVPPGKPDGKTSTGFGVEQLFGKWGDEDVFYLDGRYVSIRMVTERDPKTGGLVNKIAVYDISEADTLGLVFGRTFGLDWDGPAFALDGRPPREGEPPAKQYELKFAPGENGPKVVLRRLGAKGPIAANKRDYDRIRGGQDPLGITRGDLERLRREHAKTLAHESEVGGKAYYAMPQSASGRGCYQFIDKASFRVAFFGCVNESAGGEERPIRDEWHNYVGTYGGYDDPGNQVHYYLAEDRDRNSPNFGIWRVVEKDHPPKPPKLLDAAGWENPDGRLGKGRDGVPADGAGHRASTDAGTQFDAEEVRLFAYEKFPPSIDVQNREYKLKLPAELEGAEKLGAALYGGPISDESGAPKRYYLRFRLELPVTAADKPEPIMSGEFHVFSDPVEENKFSTLPPDKDLRGIRLGSIVVDKPDRLRNMGFKPLARYAPAGKKGAVAVYDGPEGQRTNCIGIVLWWGGERGEFESECKRK